MTAEVDRCGRVVDLVRQDGQLVVNPFTNREPMIVRLALLLEYLSNAAVTSRLQTERSFVLQSHVERSFVLETSS